MSHETSKSLNKHSSMKGSYSLIGGGEIRRGETKEIDDVIKQLAPRKAILVFFGTAAGDNLEYINTIKSVFESHFTVVAPTEQDGPEFARSAIDAASVIYFGGGTTQLLKELFEKWNLIGSLQDALERGVCLVGMSAGAEALSALYIHEDEGHMELRQGWGILPLCVLVHACKESFERAKKIWEDNPPANADIFIGIGEGAAWCGDHSRVQKIGRGAIWSVNRESFETIDRDVNLL